MVKDLKGISNGLDLSDKITVASEATVFKYLPAILTSQQEKNMSCAAAESEVRYKKRFNRAGIYH